MVLTRVSAHLVLPRPVRPLGRLGTLVQIDAATECSRHSKVFLALILSSLPKGPLPTGKPKLACAAFTPGRLFPMCTPHCVADHH